MREMRCGECGVIFWAPEFLMAERQRTGQRWYCPNGHCRLYAETDAQKLQKELDAEKQRVQMERSMRFSAEAQRDRAQKELKRVQKRISAGVCTCCNRTFQNLSRHMQTKHPEVKNAQM